MFKHSHNDVPSASTTTTDDSSPLPLSKLQDLLRQLKPQDELAQQALLQAFGEMENKWQEFEAKEKSCEKLWLLAQQGVLPPNFSLPHVKVENMLKFQKQLPTFVGLKLNPQAESLTLSNTPLNNLAIYCLADAIAANARLTSLTLRQIALSDFGVYCLAKALARNTALLQINLSDNDITPVGFYFLSCLMAVNTSLKIIHLGGNKMDSDAMSALYLSAGILKNSENAGVLNELSFYDMAIGDEVAATLALALKGNSPLVRLNVGKCGISSEGFRKLSEGLISNSTLTSLRVRGNPLGNWMFPSFGALTELHLSKMCIDDLAVCALSQLLANNTVLTDLDLGENSFKKEGVVALVSALEQNTTLQSLKLHRSDNAFVVSAFKHNRTLTLLELTENKIGELPSRTQGADVLSSAVETTFYREDFWKYLQMSVSLLKVYLMSNALGDEDALALAQILLINTVLTGCYIAHNRIGDKGAKALSIAVQKNTVLTSLNLAGNLIGDAGVIDLALSLRGNSSLRTLNLFRNPFGQRGAEALVSLGLFGENTRPNTTLVKIELSGNIAGEQPDKIQSYCSANNFLFTNREKVTLSGLCDKVIHAKLQM